MDDDAFFFLSLVSVVARGVLPREREKKKDSVDELNRLPHIIEKKKHKERERERPRVVFLLRECFFLLHSPRLACRLERLLPACALVVLSAVTTTSNDVKVVVV